MSFYRTFIIYLSYNCAILCYSIMYSFFLIHKATPSQVLSFLNNNVFILTIDINWGLVTCMIKLIIIKINYHYYYWCRLRLIQITELFLLKRDELFVNLFIIYFWYLCLPIQKYKMLVYVYETHKKLYFCRIICKIHFIIAGISKFLFLHISYIWVLQNIIEYKWNQSGWIPVIVKVLW